MAKFYYHTVYVGWETRRGLAWVPDSRSLETAINCKLNLRSYLKAWLVEDSLSSLMLLLTELSSFQVVVGLRASVLSGGWSELLSVPCHIGFSIGDLTQKDREKPDTNRPSRVRQGPPRWKPVFETVILKVVSHHFCHILFIGRKPINLVHAQSEGWYNNINTRRWGSLGWSLWQPSIGRSGKSSKIYECTSGTVCPSPDMQARS